jgi:predicted DCC family thiol-disulfide oxidoreductase YuxK
MVPRAQTDTIFYDGECGLCSRSVRFVMRRDSGGKAFRFAPLQGETFARTKPQNAMPETMVVKTSDGQFLLRSSAWVHILRRLGGGWSWIGAMLGLIPRPIRDGVYDLVARTRHRLFPAPVGVCEILSADQRTRFDP